MGMLYALLPPVIRFPSYSPSMAAGSALGGPRGAVDTEPGETFNPLPLTLFSRRTGQVAENPPCSTGARICPKRGGVKGLGPVKNLG